MIVGIHHIAIGVPDFEAGLAFYRDVLGFEQLSASTLVENRLADRCIGLADTHAEVAMLKAPNAFIELWSYRHPAPADRGARPCDFGYPHFALQVQDIEQEHARLTELGMKFAASEPVSFGTSSAIYGEDPFGNVIELYEIRDETTPQLAR